MQLTSVDLRAVRPDQTDAFAGWTDKLLSMRQSRRSVAQIVDVQQRLGHQRAPGRMLAKMARRDRHVG
jgi:hypothetical protein